MDFFPHHDVFFEYSDFFTLTVTLVLSYFHQKKFCIIFQIRHCMSFCYVTHLKQENHTKTSWDYFLENLKKIHYS